MKSNRIQVNLTDEVLKEIDNYASSVGLSRSSAISVLCMESLMQKKAMNTLQGMLTHLEDSEGKTSAE
jgi:metal-responsive CopG/Arc/MetJ family transcriptional regulator